MKGVIKGFITASVLVMVFMSGSASGSMHTYDYIASRCASAVDCKRTPMTQSLGWTVDWDLPWFGGGAPVWASAGVVDLEDIRRPKGPPIIWAGAASGSNKAVPGYARRDDTTPKKKPDASGMTIAGAGEERGG